MSKIKLTILSTMLVFGVALTHFGLTLEQAKANETRTEIEVENSASSWAESEAYCEAGPYGQCSARSRAEAEASVRSRIVYVDQTIIRDQVRGVYHRPADTALASFTPQLALTAMIPGLFALVVKFKQLAE